MGAYRSLRLRKDAHLPVVYPPAAGLFTHSPNSAGFSLETRMRLSFWDSPRSPRML
jgi:hypothetical protein